MDNSFLRLEKDFESAKKKSRSPAVNIFHTAAIQLLPGETYLQISNSKSDIIFNGNYEVFFVNECGVKIQDVTGSVFIKEFIDTNGIKQVAWEFVNIYEYYTTPICLMFRNTTNNDTWWTNLFLSTSYEKEFTTRLDYKSKGFHYGTQYNIADYYQSIRLRVFFDNIINESERSEYHQISTGDTVSARNIKKRKERYLLEYFDEFTIDRLEDIITSDELYLDFRRFSSSTPIEFPDREGNSNSMEGEMILNPINTNDLVFNFQIYETIRAVSFTPSGIVSTNDNLQTFEVLFNQNIQLNTGEIRLYGMNGDLISIFDSTELSVTDNRLFPTNPISLPSGSEGIYYFNIDEGLISGGDVFKGIVNDSTWRYELKNPEYDDSEYNSEYLI